MMYGKIDRYILIAILILVAIGLYLLFTNKKETGGQSDLLRAMAEKLRVSTPDTSDQNKKPTETVQEKYEKTPEDEEYIRAIADKMCLGIQLDEEEKEFREKFSDDVLKELMDSQKILKAIVNKFVSGATDFDEYEKEFYECYQQQVDEIVYYQKTFASVISKLTSGNTDFTDQEREFQANYSKEIEQELAKIKRQSEGLKGANPPLAAGERLKMILSLFDDGIPKTVTEIAKLYAEKTNTTPSKGNMSILFGKLADEGKLLSIKSDGNKIYHGLPEWFNGKKMKPEYKQKIGS